MKNLFTHLITMQRWLRKNTMEAAAKQLSIPTVNRQSTDGQSRHQATIHPLSFVHRTLSRCTLRYVAMVAMLICLGVGV